FSPKFTPTTSAVCVQSPVGLCFMLSSRSRPARPYPTPITSTLTRCSPHSLMQSTSCPTVAMGSLLRNTFTRPTRGPRRSTITVRSPPAPMSIPPPTGSPSGRSRKRHGDTKDRGTTTFGSASLRGKRPSTLDWKSALSPVQSSRRSSTHVREMSTLRRCSDTASPVKLGVCRYPMWIVFHPEVGSHLRANSPSLLSGFPTARILLCSLDALVSAAVHSTFGMPHASSRMTSTYIAWIPWNAETLYSLGLRPNATSSFPTYHSVRFTLPAR